MFNETEGKQLGGWLILVGIGVVLNVGGNLSELLVEANILNLILLLAACYLAYLFFSKHYLFPRIYICIQLITLFIILVVLATDTMPSENEWTLLIGVAGVLIWVPYMLLSKRVKETFVEKKPYQFRR